MSCASLSGKRSRPRCTTETAPNRIASCPYQRPPRFFPSRKCGSTGTGSACPSLCGLGEASNSAATESTIGSRRKKEVDINSCLVYVSDTMTGEELRRTRLRLKMTQAQLGAELDMHKNTVARLERGELPIVRTTELSVKYLLVMRKFEGRRKQK